MRASISAYYPGGWVSSCGRSAGFCLEEEEEAQLHESHIDAGGGGSRGALLLFFLFFFMDAVKSEARKAATAASGENGMLRRPLVPSEKGNAAAAPAGRRREVASRFKPDAPPAPASTAARRCTSPSPGRASSVDGSAPRNRARSADRARPAAPPSGSPSSRLKSSAATSRSASPARDVAAEAHGAPPRGRATSANAPNGLWASARCPSPSLRSQAPVPAPAKKIDRLVRGLPSEQGKAQAGAAAERKRSPLRGNSVGNQQCENARPSELPTRVVEQHRWPAMMNGRGSASVASRSIAAPAAVDKSSRSSSSNLSPQGTVNCLNRPLNGMAKKSAVHRSRREDKAESGSDSSSQTSESSKSACRRSRAISLPVPVLHRSSSPSKVMSAASKACQSPSSIRPSAPCRSKCSSASAQPVFNYLVDAWKGKKSAGQIHSIHQLRLLDNRYLQWRFVNAHSEVALSSQKISVESILYSVWKSILNLRDALTITRIDLRHLQTAQKLYNILRGQIGYLEHWPLLEENSKTLVEAIDALKASTMRLLVTSGAQAEAVTVKNAISSAVDVMQALNSSISYLQLKVEDRVSLVSELSVMARQEKAALDECRELLAPAAKLQVQESSLRTHLMQLRQGVAG